MTRPPLPPAYRPRSTLPCLRSANNYPHHVARRLRPTSFTDVTCQGAGATDLSKQLAALSRETTLVTLTIGAQAIAARDVILKCTVAGALVLHGSPCRDGRDELHRPPALPRCSTPISPGNGPWPVMFSTVCSRAAARTTHRTPQSRKSRLGRFPG
ncbi:hypothetical protein [Streptomyces cinnamoneus]|uniref:Uncharacterized protein n=1 Tax=Streptomyces cinnamoneus TaxID=53446 RepID=A0A918TRH9_STRCJ|nr:hypothetical protein [Streptomyces cinnamoneus]GHC59875.1 hypothetical protein GCM10010507_41000 [Streptomyces cinnamoneus]